MKRAKLDGILLNQGLLTEADPLNAPVGAAAVDVNMDIRGGGSRHRRRGLEVYKADPQHATFGSNFFITKGGRWEAAPGKYWVWVLAQGPLDPTGQGAKLAFYVELPNGALSLQNIVSVDCDATVATAGDTVYYIKGSGFGGAASASDWVCAAEIDTVNNTVKHRQYRITMRDVWGVPKVTSNDVRPLVSALSSGEIARHEYNLYNQGWPERAKVLAMTDTPETEDPDFHDIDPRSALRQGSLDARYPNDRDLYQLFKVDQARSLDAIGALYMHDAERISVPSSSPPKGREIFDYRQRVRNMPSVPGYSERTVTVSGTPHLVKEMAVYAGRVFYAFHPCKIVPLTGGEVHSNVPPFHQFLGYSQSLVSPENVGKLYTEAFVGDEYDGEVVDTDGGLIQAEGLGVVHKMVPFSSSLYIFSTTGVWELYAEGRFSPTNYGLHKVSNIPTTSPQSIREIGDAIVYAAHDAIYAVSADPVSLRGTTKDISSEKVRGLYNSLSVEQKATIFTALDEANDEILFLYTREFLSAAGTVTWRATEALILHQGLGIWRQNRFADMALRRGSGTVSQHQNWSDYLFLDSYTDLSRSGGPLTFLTAEVVKRRPSGAVTENAIFRLSYSETPTVFQDSWGQFAGVGIPTQHGAELQTFFFSGGAPSEQKVVSGVVTVMCERTETGYTVGSNGAITFTHPSSCRVQGRWDWHGSVGDGIKWSQVREAYRLPEKGRPGSGEVDFGTNVVTSKIRMRGRGRSLALRFTSNGNNDMRFLGYGMEVSSNEKF